MKRKLTNLINIAMLIIAVFTIVLQIYPPKTGYDQVRNILLLLGILLLVGVSYMLLWLYEKGNHYIDEIQQSKEGIESLRHEMSTKNYFNALEKRIIWLEAGKKGELDPRWVLLIILLVLFYLYLRTYGIVP